MRRRGGIDFFPVFNVFTEKFPPSKQRVSRRGTSCTFSSISLYLVHTLVQNGKRDGITWSKRNGGALSS